MAVFANLAPNISDTQTQSFYFTVVFTTISVIEDFSLANTEISGSSDVSISNLSIIQVEGNYAIIAVNLPKGVSGSFVINLIGTVTVDGVVETIDYQSKTIEYDTTSLVISQQTYDTTPPLSQPTEVKLSVSAAHIQNGGTIIAQFDFDFDTHYFSESYVTVSAGATKGTAEAIDNRHRRWVVLVTVPQSGEGAVEISIAENALGFQHEAVSASVQYAEYIPLIIEPG